MSRSTFRLIGLALACLALTLPASAAQQQLGAIQGTITDQTHAVLPGVTVTVTSTETGIARATVTNEAGVYRVPGLDPGRYDVIAELQGFRTTAQNNVTISVGSTIGVNFTLAPGTVSEAVEVRATAPDIQTEKADVSAVVEQKKINDLPLVGRNVLSLAALQPGINGIPSSTDFLTAEQGMGITANGVRESGNHASVDGASIDGGPWGGTFLVVPNVEAVQEFQVIANNPSAEYGRNSGATVSIITKGGTNEFTGSGFWFHRDDNLRSLGFFEDEKAPFKRNDFGGSVGGPIVRDNSFFFVSYEGVREQTPQSFLTTVETQQLVDWVNANRPGSNAAQLFSKYAPPSYPTSNLQDIGSPLPGANVWSDTPDGIPDIGEINVVQNGKRDGNQINTRFDQVLRGAKDRLRVTYYMTQLETPNLYVRSQFNHPFPFRNQLFNAIYSTILSNQTLNEFNFGIARQHGETGDPTPDSPTIGINDVSGFGVDFWHPITFTQNNFQIKDTLTMNRGTHSFKTGGEVRLGRDGATLHHWERPNYFFQSILDFVDDEPFSEDRAVDPETGDPVNAYGKYLTNEWALFIQDNWKVRPNLTLNLGLRYDNFGNPGKDQIPFNGIILGPGATLQEQIATASVNTVDHLYGTDWNNFGPRLGVSWDPSGNGDFVVRAGGGISYNRINNTVFSDERLNPPQFAHASATADSGVPLVYSLGPDYAPNPAFATGLDEHGGIRGARVSLRVVDPDTQIPTYYNWFAGVQKELGGHFVVEANYNATKGRHLMSSDGPVGQDYNRFNGDLLDGVRDRLNPSFAQVAFGESSYYSDYQGLTFQLQRRYADGLAFQAAYTFGVGKDVVEGITTDVNDIGLDYGYSDNDVRHKLAMNVVWEIPYRSPNAAVDAVLGGWQLNAISILQSGEPFSVFCNQAWPRCDFNADGIANERLDVSGSADIDSPSQDDWLNGVLDPSAFTNPTGSASNQERNSFRGPGFKNLDLSLFKNFAVPGRGGARAAKLQVRLEVFNIGNWVNFNNPSGSITSNNFGRVTSARGGTGGPRTMQIGLKYIF